MIFNFAILGHLRLIFCNKLEILGNPGFYKFGLCTGIETTTMLMRVDVHGTLIRAPPSDGYYSYCCEICFEKLIDIAWVTPELPTSRRILDSNWVKARGN